MAQAWSTIMNLAQNGSDASQKTRSIRPQKTEKTYEN